MTKPNIKWVPKSNSGTISYRMIIPMICNVKSSNPHNTSFLSDSIDLIIVRICFIIIGMLVQERYTEPSVLRLTEAFKEADETCETCKNPSRIVFTIKGEDVVSRLTPL